MIHDLIYKKIVTLLHSRGGGCSPTKTFNASPRYPNVCPLLSAFLSTSLAGPLEMRGEMHAPTNTSAGELFIVDNNDELWKGLKYLHDWTEIASAFDIATAPTRTWPLI